MATNFLWGAVGTVANLLTTELNSLANGAGTVYGPEVGGVNAVQLGQLSFHIASNTSAFTAASYVSVFFVPSITTATGGTYPTYTSGASYKLAENNYLVANIAINPATQSGVVDEVFPGVIIPLGYYKVILVNHTGFALPSSGNTLNLYSTPTQY